MLFGRSLFLIAIRVGLLAGNGIQPLQA